MRRITVSRLLILAMLVGGVFIFSGCEIFSSPQNTFAPTGEVAKDQKNIFLLTMWPALVILIGVEFGLVYILWRFRRKKGDSGLPTQTHGNNQLEIAWTIAPILLLALFIAPTVGGIVDLGRTPKNALEVRRDRSAVLMGIRLRRSERRTSNSGATSRRPERNPDR